MPPGFVILTSALALAQFLLPKRLAFLPLLIAACHLGNIEIAANITPCRLMIVLGLVKAIASGEFKWSSSNRIDLLFLTFSCIAIIVSFVPRLDIPSPFKQNLGLILNAFGSYLYGRAFLSGPNAVQSFARALSIILLPLAIFLTIEHTTRQNTYKMLGARSAQSVVREGKNRAAGPFQHPILAGTMGAVSFPFMIFLWKRDRKRALLGLGSSLAIVYASSSSGPLAALMLSMLCCLAWKYRQHITRIHKLSWVTIVILHLISTRGIWYLMARIDLTGGSTGYHRARLIDSAMGSFGRWWLAGTDYTRDWMFSGVSWSDRHTDLTNYYIHLGVIGGLGLMLTFIAIQFNCFTQIGKELKRSQYANSFNNQSLWFSGCALLSHSVGMVSISYFDQMYAPLYVLIGLISNMSDPNNAGDTEISELSETKQFQS